MRNKARTHSTLIPIASEAFSESILPSEQFLPSLLLCAFLNSIPQQMPGFLLRSGNLIVMDAVGEVCWSLSRKGKTSICILYPLLLLWQFTCLPHVKGVMQPRFSPRTHIRCRDPKAPDSLEKCCHKRGVQTDANVAVGKVFGGRKPRHYT